MIAVTIVCYLGSAFIFAYVGQQLFGDFGAGVCGIIGFVAGGKLAGSIPWGASSRQNVTDNIHPEVGQLSYKSSASQKEEVRDVAHPTEGSSITFPARVGVSPTGDMSHESRTRTADTDIAPEPARLLTELERYVQGAGYGSLMEIVTQVEKLQEGPGIAVIKLPTLASYVVVYGEQLRTTLEAFIRWIVTTRISRSKKRQEWREFLSGNLKLLELVQVDCREEHTGSVATVADIIANRLRKDGGADVRLWKQ